jgi:hypothetical protein
MSWTWDRLHRVKCVDVATSLRQRYSVPSNEKVQRADAGWTLMRLDSEVFGAKFLVFKNLRSETVKDDATCIKDHRAICEL